MNYECKESGSKDDSCVKTKISSFYHEIKLGQQLKEMKKVQLKPLKLKTLSAESDNESVTTFSSIEPFELPPPALTPEYENSEHSLNIDLSSGSPSLSSDDLSESFTSNEESSMTTSSEEDEFCFKLPPAAILSSNDEILRPSLSRKGGSWGTNKLSDELNARFNLLSINTEKNLDYQEDDQKIHPESILNFLKKNCPIGQAKLLSTPENRDLKAPIR
ncbi:unnamed protein product [Moneuplotes crassus]|uniref:Uncharacterized protein n=1 Tax=Euplotes crassus TaxID=5936 RepID=A0AAD1UH87_EUPCR|nr:unnamed protein product [Moneuplotes crassus]